MRSVYRRVASALLIAVAAAGLLAPLIAPYSYDTQFRDSPNASPGRQFPMGTDDVGRDRYSRLVYATRISVVLAPAAAFVSIALALLISSFGGRVMSGLT